MTHRTSIKSFLAKARAALTTGRSNRLLPLNFIVGNESADLDSLCSALLLAYFHTYAGRSNGSKTREQRVTALHIPVCPLLRADLSLRPEFLAVLRDAGCGPEDVFTLEDVLPHDAALALHERACCSDCKKLRPEDTRWLLVDHNAMTGALANAFASRVVGCVDHHADEGVLSYDAEIRVIEKSGSCASLVLEHCAHIWDRLCSASSASRYPGFSGDREWGEAMKIDAQLAHLALGPILIDTANLGDINKTTAHDRRAVEIAESKIRTHWEALGGGARVAGADKTAELQPYDRTSFFNRLSVLKEDIADMSFRDVFRKDYKEWNVGYLRLGTSSVPQGFRYLVEEKSKGDTAAFLSRLESWGLEKDGLVEADEMGRHKMDLVVVLTTFVDNGGRFNRELLVWARTEKGVRAAKLFEESNKEKLALDVWESGRLDTVKGENRVRELTDWRRCWHQSALEYSRKQIAPMLRDALKAV
ncbi:exopolyphosphatase-like protein [Poronia punctata]|nr:exopolyphosphatase-like protein [Poronia punctata]